MNIQTPPAAKHQDWSEVRTRLDQNAPFSNMVNTPYYRDAVYDHFSKAEYARRHDALLVTANEREFARVPRLKFEDWAKAQ